MTCPSFSDRDQSLREQMGPPTAQQYLRASMRRDTDVRWDLLPVEPVKPPRRFPWIIEFARRCRALWFLTNRSD